MKLTKNNLLAFFSTLILIFLFWVGFQIWSFFSVPLVAAGESPVTFLYAQGTPVKKMAYSLQTRGLLKHPIYFLLLVRLSGTEYSLKAGEYVIDPGTTPFKLVQKMAKGDALRHGFTIIEGWTFKQIITALNSNQYVSHTISRLDPLQIMEKLGASGELPEGRFAPDTYLFSGEVKDRDILAQAYRLMRERLDSAWEGRDRNTSCHCPYQALIVASLIEKETAVLKEKPIISGVILRRLAKGMLLQIDPSVIYGLGSKYSGKLTRSDLAKNTPYNTYIHKGLPPTPIAMPSLESIIAALHPEASNFWYYVAKKDGTHEFSESLAEQGKAIKKYLLHK